MRWISKVSVQLSGGVKDSLPSPKLMRDSTANQVHGTGDSTIVSFTTGSKVSWAGPNGQYPMNTVCAPQSLHVLSADVIFEEAVGVGCESGRIYTWKTSRWRC